MTDVAVATTSAVADPDLDVLVGALADRGCAAVPVAWDDPSFDWDAPDVVVIRSTWDYAARVGEFLAWTTRVPRLHNPVDVVAWNADKRYLAELAERGVPVVDTTYATGSSELSFPEGRFVVKPSVGAGSRGVHRFGPDEHAAGRAHVDALGTLGLTAMVQPYLDGIEVGETAVVLVEGVVSHAVRKFAPMGLAANDLPAGPVAVDPVVASADELDVVAAVLGALPWRDPLCYTRVDLVATDAGPVVLEVELIEPYLFLTTDDDAAGTLADAIVARAGARSRDRS